MVWKNPFWKESMLSDVFLTIFLPRPMPHRRPIYVVAAEGESEWSRKNPKSLGWECPLDVGKRMEQEKIQNSGNMASFWMWLRRKGANSPKQGIAGSEIGRGESEWSRKNPKSLGWECPLDVGKRMEQEKIQNSSK